MGESGDGGPDRARRDGLTVRDVPKALLLLVVEFGVFPWHTFKDNEAARRASIGFTAVVAAALPAVALVNGNLAFGLGLVAVLGGALLVMVLADRRIAGQRIAEQARRAEARAAVQRDQP